MLGLSIEKLVRATREAMQTAVDATTDAAESSTPRVEDRSDERDTQRALAMVQGRANPAPGAAPRPIRKVMRLEPRATIDAPRYQVPSNLKPKKVGVGKRIAAGLGTTLLAPIYLGVAAVVAIPSVAVGAVQRARASDEEKTGSFMSGFAKVYKPAMGWLNKPVYGLVGTMASPGRAFYVDRDTSPGEVILTARIHLEGSAADVAKVKAKEAAIEEHLAIEGYRVNVEFVSAGTKGASTVQVRGGVHPMHNLYNPDASPRAIAHEIMHMPLGLLDRYDLSAHYDNQTMGFGRRLGVFLHSLVQPKVDHRGIMGTSSKPLPSEYEAVLRSVGEAR